MYVYQTNYHIKQSTVVMHKNHHLSLSVTIAIPKNKIPLQYF